MNSNQIRDAFLNFWTDKPRNAKVVPNASLVPNNDPTLLFVNSGMFPLVPYLGGEPHPLGTRLTNVQRCIRTVDIEEVGDYNHLILFEMIGNWSLGDFSKKEQILWKMELYVEHFGLDPNRIYASVWAGDDSIPRDDEAIEAWIEAFQNYGITAEFSEDVTKVPQGADPSTAEWIYRIFPYDKSDNWWQRGPDTPGELGGPSSEIFYDMGSPIYETGAPLHINDDSGRYLEVGNSVFMEYQYSDDGTWEPMRQKNVDFGGGLDRIVAVVQGKRSIYETDLFVPIIKKIEQLSGKTYDPTDQNSAETISFRIVAEHARSTTFILADGVVPGSKDQAYILRRLIRRMIRHAKKLGIDEDFTGELVEIVIKQMNEAYPHLSVNGKQITEEMVKEEQNFRRTLNAGEKEFFKIVKDIKRSSTPDRNFLTGDEAFHLYETYGFPVEMTQELSNEIDFGQIPMIDFETAMKKHQDTSRAGAVQKFAGGLADHSDEVVKLHTAHHLLLKALQMVLGDHVKQRGSNITGERLRIDFNHDEKMTPEQKEEVERIINEKIKAGLDVVRIEMPREEAEEIGAEMEFGQKYPDIVSVYVIGDGLTSGDETTSLRLQEKEYFSAEFCGGPHVKNTSEIGAGGRKFKIVKEQSSSAGIRRIKAKLV